MWDSCGRLCASRALIRHHGNMRLWPCVCHLMLMKVEVTYQLNAIFFKQRLSCQEKMESWFVQLDGASLLLALHRWPMLDWKTTTEAHKTKHTINGHLLRITHSKMSALLIPMPLRFPDSQAWKWKDAGHCSKAPAALYVYASFMDWQRFTKKRFPRKTEVLL